ncbi:DUF1761 domain-containing protein [Patescibacteria group bacterium]|nr:DUF1761 domain-containing protein [Patescibacteria group bacterium]
MSFGDIDYKAVLAITVLIYILAFVWYGPLFGKLWMKLAKVTKAETKENSMQKMVLGFVNTFVTVLFTALFVMIAGGVTWADGALVGFYISIGFAGTIMFSSMLWAKKPFNLFLLDGIFRLVTFMLIGALYAWWPY